MKLSIIILTRSEKLLKKCLNSISNTKLPKKTEIIVINDGVGRNIKNVAKEFPQIKFLVIEKTTCGNARNAGIKIAKGEIIHLLDDDVVVDKNLFLETIESFNEHKDIAIIGGPNLTPKNNSILQKCFGYVMQSWFGAAQMRLRYIKSKKRIANEKNLISCNLAIRRKALMESKILFNPKFIANEENVLLQELENKGCRMMYNPKMIVYHNRRKNLSGLIIQLFKYGRGRAHQTKYMLKAFSPIFVIPSIFLLYLFSLIFFHHLSYLFPLYLYLLIDLVTSVNISISKNKLRILPLMAILFPIEHLSYGAGFIYGIFENTW